MAFRPERLVTEGVLYLVALACTLVLLLAPGQTDEPTKRETWTPAARGRTATGRDRRRGFGRRNPVDPCGLGDRARDLRRPIRWPRGVAHPFPY